MKSAVLIFALFSWAVPSVAAQGFNLSKSGIGPIYIESLLSHAGPGDHLEARARNDSHRTIKHFKLCVTADRGCLFTLWNTEPWAPGAVLNWNLDSARPSKKLAHTVALTEIEAIPLPKAPKPPKAPCSGPTFLQSLAIGLAAGAAAASPPVPSSSAGTSEALLLFGGEDHKVFLGCLNCSQYETDSVLNGYGQFGNSFSTESIFNRYGEYGSPYSTFSACNSYATDPPVIVNHSGAYYGRLTINRYQDPTHLSYYAAWIAGVCQR